MDVCQGAGRVGGGVLNADERGIGSHWRLDIQFRVYRVKVKVYRVKVVGRG